MEITVKVNYKNEKLQKLRQAAGLSQSQLAEAAGVNVRMYQKYEQGDRVQPQSIMEEQESRRELYDGLKRLTQREQTYLLYRYGFTDGEEHPLIGTAIYFHLTKGRAKKTEEQAMDNLWLELPWWFL